MFDKGKYQGIFLAHSKQPCSRFPGPSFSQRLERKQIAVLIGTITMQDVKQIIEISGWITL